MNAGDIAAPAVLVTGAYGGIGWELVRGVHARGRHPILVGRDPAQLEQAVERLGGPGAATTVTADLSDPEAAESAIAASLSRVRRLDAAIACAAEHGPTGAVDAVPIASVRATLEVNVLGVLATVRAVLPVMRRQGRGNLVLFSSGAGTPTRRPDVRSLAYQVSKFGIEGLVNGLAVELRGSGVNVNGIRPGRTLTRANRDRARSTLRSPEQAVDAVWFLASLAPDELTGFVLEATQFDRGFRPERGDHTLPR